MIRPATKHTFEILAGLMAVLIMGGAALAFTLASGPLSLKFLAPSVASYLSEQVGGYRVDVRDAVMRWSPESRTVEFKIVGVDFFDRSGTQAASIPEMDVGFVMTGWREGVIAPTRVSLDHASAIIERDANGTFSIGAPNKGKDGSSFAVVLRRLLASQSKGGGLGLLSELSVKDFDVTVIDRRTGAVLRSRNARLTFQRTATGFRSHLEAPAQIAGERFAVTVDGDFDKESQRGEFNARFTPVRLSRLARLSDFYKDLAPFDIGVGGNARVQLDANASITRADFSLASNGGTLLPFEKGAAPISVQSASFAGIYWPANGHISIGTLKFEASGNRADVKGELMLRKVENPQLRIAGFAAKLVATNIGIQWPTRFPEPVTLASASIDADVTLGAEWRAQIASAKLSFGPSRASMAGTIAHGERSPALKLQGEITDFDVGQLDRLWPIGLAEHAREWVAARVHAGQLTKGVLKIDAPAGALAAEPVDEGVMLFAFHVEKGVATYAPRMPDITDVVGDMTLTPNTFKLDLAHGRILDAEITGGTVFIPALGVPGTMVEVVGEGRGSLTEVLKIVDSERLQLVSKYGLKPESFSGEAQLKMKFDVPQIFDGHGDEFIYRIEAKASDVKAKGIVGDVAIDHGTLDMTVDEHRLDATGKFALNGAASSIVWREKFQDNVDKPTEFSIKTTLDDEARAALGLDSGRYVMGPVGIDVRAKGRGTDLSDIAGKLDLTASTVDLGDYEWTKAARVPAGAAFDAHIGEDGAIAIKSLTATGRGIDVNGRANIAANGKLLSAKFPHLKLDGLSDVALNVERERGNAIFVRATGSYLNLGPFLKQALDDGGKAGSVPWRIEAKLDTAKLRKGVTTKDLSASIVSSAERLNAVEVKASFDAASRFSANLSESADGVRWLMVNSNDAGKAIKGITGVESFLGGQIALNVRLAGGTGLVSAPVAPPAGQATTTGVHNPASDISGSLRIDDFKVVNAPILAKLLTVGSLQGIGDLLNGEGIQFKRLDAPFWMHEGRIGIEDGRASGPAIGITMQGVVDRREKVTDLNGTIVPAYTLNSVLGNVPVVGQLLVSREGEGVFGFTYNVAGVVDEPKIMVNPLSALAPGFLRRLFQLGETQAGELRTREAPAAQ